MAETQNLNKSPEQVGAMFNDIAYRYDFLNHFLSLGIDKVWRKKLIRRLNSGHPKTVLDIATGTADLAIQLAKSAPNVKITGIDIANQMLEVGRQKLNKSGLSDRISLIYADSLSIPFPDASFDAAMVAFGVRNFADPVKGMNEAYRVLKPDGKLFVLEFSMPKGIFMPILYRIYFKAILPLIGRFISGHRMAYTYLPDSVTSFPDGEDFINLMIKAGFKNCVFKPLSFGIATLYEGEKL